MKWNLSKEKMPIFWRTGDWDGNRSDLCICQDTEYKYHLAHAYEYYDGQIEWYDQDDFGLRHEIVKWIYIPD